MPEIPTQSQPTPNQKSVNWKRILIIAVIGAVIVGLGVLIFLILQTDPETTSTVTTKKATPSATTATPSAKKDETADWEVYSDSYKGKKLTFKYPKDWFVDKQSDDKYVDYKVKKGDKIVEFFNNYPTGPGIPNKYPEKKIEDKMTTKTLMVEFDGKQVEAAEYISKIDSDWEIWGYLKEGPFSFDLYSSKVPSNKDRLTMLKIVSAFKFLD